MKWSANAIRKSVTNVEVNQTRTLPEVNRYQTPSADEANGHVGSSCVHDKAGVEL